MGEGVCTRVGRGPVKTLETGAGFPPASLGNPMSDVANEFLDLFFDVHGVINLREEGKRR